MPQEIDENERSSLSFEDDELENGGELEKRLLSNPIASLSHPTALRFGPPRFGPGGLIHPEGLPSPHYPPGAIPGLAGFGGPAGLGWLPQFRSPALNQHTGSKKRT